MDIPAFLACPECQSTELSWSESLESLAPPFDTNEGVHCNGCGRDFPHVEGIWVMWSDQVKKIELQKPSDDAPLSDRVKWANVKIYDEISDDYGEHHDGSQPYAETQLFLKAIADDAQTKPEPGRQRVLVDVGCATGVSLDIGSKGYEHVVGADISLNNLRAVARKGHTAVLADADKLPFAGNSVDLMTCFATLHHFPDPPQFLRTGQRSLRPGGVLMTACEPTTAALRRGFVAEMVWQLRKPVYRFLSRFSPRFYLHKDKEQQEVNDLAEINRTMGGFDPKQLSRWLDNAGLTNVKVFYGTDPSGFRKYEMPHWKLFVLKALSLQNPIKRSNWVNVTAIGQKAE